ncbi:glutathione peroxidase [Peredibacter starrii]|uniref:Glutathione peroxidase n=1 Tax=Peredibacter starrii TaxID=28202 RepID=A0AAX4HVV0_9BACT|nr:glutathione peroxidase [Peredibacter starrii]WPU67140.1 glutathione peroxidase [Peredibacter starrii]
MAQSVFDYTVKDIDGKDVSLSQYKGKFLLIVNVASKCGFTPQYKGLEQLFEDLKDNVVVLGFPCNQFGAQEPGDAEEIKNFCSLTYDVKFPLFAKIDVNGPKASPLYQFLKKQKRGLLGTGMIKWNFTKFLINREGQVVKRYAPNDKPEDIKKDLSKLL